MLTKKTNYCNILLAAMTVMMLLTSNHTLAATYQFEILHAFSTENARTPTGPRRLLQAQDSNLYGIARTLANEQGVVFKVNNLQSKPNYSEYFRFASDFDNNKGNEFVMPRQLTQASNGSFYITGLGPGAAAGPESLYKITSLIPPKSSFISVFPTWMDDYTVSHKLLENRNGNFYTTTAWGGDAIIFDSAHLSGGSLIEIDTHNKNPGTNVKVLHNFGIDGFNPNGGVININGVLYGTTCFNASTVNGELSPVKKGVIYRYDLNATAKKYKVIHRFDGRHGACPQGELLKARNGKLYGVTSSGGYANNGVIFEFDINGAKPSYRVVHYFNGVRGSHPHETLVQSTKTGSIYGVTTSGGRLNKGHVFKLDVLPNSSLFTLVHRFDGSTSGENAQNILIGKDNHLYGITFGGGPLGGGLVYRIKL